jgi:hypothetical protein
MNNKNFILVVVAVAIVVTGSFWYYFSQGKTARPVEEENWVCTQEALICPDGSGVGRTGKECKFNACPNHASFKGVLRQDQNGFNLLMEAPLHGGIETSYVMPLEIKVSNVLGQMVGKKVEVFGNFREGNTLVVDRLEELKGEEGSVTTGKVKVGQTVFMNGVRVTLNSIVQDNRCPANVNCIVAGWVTAKVTLQSNTDKETLEMRSDKAPTLFDSYKVSIESISPISYPGVKPKASEYTLTFKVISN